MSTPRLPERDRLLVFDIYAEAQLYASRRELTADGCAAAVAGGKRCERAEQARAGQE